MTAMVADDDISFLQPGEHTGRIRLLADVCMRRTVEQPAWEEIEHCLFKQSYLQHFTVKRCVLWAIHRQERTSYSLDMAVLLRRNDTTANR